MSNEDLQRAFRASLRLNFLSVFTNYPWIRYKAAEFYTEIAEGFFGVRFITTGTAPYSFKWRDYLTYLYTLSFSPTKNIDVTGPATLTGIGDIAGINLTGATASLTRSINTIIIYYQGLTDKSITLTYKANIYNIPLSVGRNYLGISIGASNITVLDETGGITNIPIISTDPPITSEEYTLQISNCILYGLNLFNNLNTENIQLECNNIKLLALRRIKE